MAEIRSVFIHDSPDKCYLCGKWKSSSVRIDYHHVFGGPSSVKSASERYGFLVHLCRNCHSLIHDNERGSSMKLYLHQRGQMIYEEKFGSRQDFIKEFIRSYL